MPDAGTFEAATKFVSTAGTLGVLVAIIVSLFRGWWLPMSLHHEAVASLRAQLARSELEAERWRNVALDGHGVLKEAVRILPGNGVR